MKTPQKLPHLPNKQAGAVGMLELLVAVLITSVGLLGIASSQLKSLKNANELMARTQAMEMANDMLDRMRLDRVAALAGNYDNSFVAAEPDPDAPVPATTFADTEIAAWRTSIAQLIPSGEGQAAVTGLVASISIRWGDPAEYKTLDITGEI
jgi:type IV pilus assembly protein PilV